MSRKKSVRAEKISNTRLLTLFLFFLSAMVILLCRVGWHQIVMADKYEVEAITQQKSDIPLEAPRGTIMDRNGNELAKASISYTIWASYQNMTNEEEDKLQYEKNTKKMAEILNLSVNEIRESMEGIEGTIVIKKHETKSNVELLRQESIPGVFASVEVERLYPHGNFAAHLLGSVTDVGEGISGIEMKYENFLAGTDGRWVNNTDANGNDLLVGDSEYYPSVSGSDIVLTIDQAIQYYTEDVVNRAHEKHASEQVSAIVMDVETGDILAVASTPAFDPNDPRVPLDPKEKILFNKMSNEEQVNYLYKMWRNPIFNDVYEPGSTFKLLTVAMSLEEGLVDLKSTFECKGVKTVEDARIQCAIYPSAHGKQTLSQAVSNSCNTAHVEMATALGIGKFYDYLDLFGITEYTGIDYPGEAAPIMQGEESAGPVGIATMGFGQGIAVTPIQLITAISSIGNEGNLMQPRLVKEIVSENNETTVIEPNVVRQTVSVETAEQVKAIMSNVVAEGTATGAKIEGYKVGGKTATSQVVEDGRYVSKNICSFVTMAPMDDPKIAVLFINYSPTKEGTGSGTSAVPWGKEIMESTLRYLNIPPTEKMEDTNKYNAEYVKVPNVIGKTKKEAIGIMERAGFKYNISPQEIVDKDFEVMGQFPASGEKIKKGSIIYIYKD